MREKRAVALVKVAGPYGVYRYARQGDRYAKLLIIAREVEVRKNLTVQQNSCNWGDVKNPLPQNNAGELFLFQLRQHSKGIWFGVRSQRRLNDSG